MSRAHKWTAVHTYILKYADNEEQKEESKSGYVTWNCGFSVYTNRMVGGKQRMVFKAHIFCDGFGCLLWEKICNGILSGMDIHSNCDYSKGNE